LRNQGGLEDDRDSAEGASFVHSKGNHLPGLRMASDQNDRYSFRHGCRLVCRASVMAI
jgi:hypothetical protein